MIASMTGERGRTGYNFEQSWGRLRLPPKPPFIPITHTLYKGCICTCFLGETCVSPTHTLYKGCICTCFWGELIVPPHNPPPTHTLYKGCICTCFLGETPYTKGDQSEKVYGIVEMSDWNREEICFPYCGLSAMDARCSTIVVKLTVSVVCITAIVISQ